MKGTAQKLIFACLIAACSADAFYKYLGVVGIVGYTAFCIAVVLVLARPSFVKRLDDLASERIAIIIGSVTFIAIIIFCLWIYPLADAGRLGDRGSDADDALILAAQALLHGQYPFYPTTYYGNPIAPMPGSILLAIPFAAKPWIALQNVFWLAVLLWAAAKELRSWTYALLLLLTLVVACPAVMQNLLTATDRLSNTIYILVSMWLLLRLVPDENAPWWKRLLPAILLGIGLSSRSNFFFLVPIFFFALGRQAGWQRAVKTLAFSGVTFLAVTLPFWLYDPAGFSPLTTQAMKMAQFDSTLPHASLIVTISGMAVAIALALRKANRDLGTFFLHCGIVQLFSVLLLSAISTVHSGKLDLYFGHVSYGVFAVVFFVFAGVIWLRKLPAFSEPLR